VIAGVPLGPDGLAALAAVMERRGPPAGRLDDALERALAAAPRPVDLGAVLARRPPPAPAGSGAAAARFVRRLERRARTLQGPTAPIPDDELAHLGRRFGGTFPSPPPDLEAVGLWVAIWAEPDPARRRDLVAMAPPARARWVGHAPRPGAR
jgi:hypothetical protein